LVVERQEAAAVWQARASGMHISHRPNVHPFALLGISFAVAPVKPAPSRDFGVVRVVGGHGGRGRK
jgi:hypothetical protein